MSKNLKKPDFGTDPRNKSALPQGQLPNKSKSRRMPPPANLSMVAKKENIPETTSTPTKQWGPAATPDTPDKTARTDWAATSLPYQTPRSRASVSNAEFPSLTAVNGTPRDVAPQKEAQPHRTMDRPPVKKPQENSYNSRNFNASNGTKYPQRTERSIPSNSRSNNSYSNRPPHRGRNNYPPNSRHHPSYDRDEGVHEMFADSDAPGPAVRSLPTRHANFESDMDDLGWAGKQDNVDYTEKIKFDSSGEEDEEARVGLRKIGPPKISADLSQFPNKNQADPPLHKELTRTQQVPEFRSNSPDSQRHPGPNIQSQICIMKRPTSDTTAEIPDRGSDPTTPTDEVPLRTIPQIPKQPQTTSMRHTVPALPSSSAQASETQRSSEQTSRPAPEQNSRREDAWRQDKPHASVVSTMSLPVKGSNPPANVWEKRQPNEASEQQRQELQGFPKLGENDPIKSLTIIPTKIAEKHESAGGRGLRGQDDDVFGPDKGAYHRERGQDSWEYRRERERHKSDDKRQFGRHGSNSKFGNEAEKSHNWRSDIGNDTEERGNKFGDKGNRFEKDGRYDRNERDERYNQGERYDRNDRGRRDDRSDRGSSSRGSFPRRDNDWERNGRQNRSEGKQTDNWREKDSSNDKGERRQFRDNDRRQFRDNDRGQFRDNDRGQFRENERGQFRENDRGQFRDNERRQFRDSERRPFRENDRDRGQFRDHERGDKYGKKSSEGRQGFGPRPAPSGNNFSYASVVSNKGENEDEDWTADQDGERVKPETQDNWRQPRPEATTGHTRYSQQRKMHPTFSDPDGSDAVPRNAEPAGKTEAEWTDLQAREDSRTEEGDRDSTTPTETGFTEIRKKSRGKGVFSGEVEATRSLGRGRSRPQDDTYGNRCQEGSLGSRSMTQPNKPLSSGTDSRYTRGSSPQKSQGAGRSRALERQSNTSPKRSTQKAPDYDKKATQHPRADSPPLSQKSSSGAANNYVQPGISFSAIASKNIVAPPPPPPPGKSPQTDDKDSDQSADSNDEAEVARKEQARPVSDSFSPDLKIQDMSEKGEHLSDENDEVQEVMTTTIVNSDMIEEVAEIDKTPHASMLAHSEQKEEIEAGFENADKAVNEWDLLEDRVPTPQKQPDKLTELQRHAPAPSKLEERPRSITPQSSQPVSTSAPAPERKKSDDPLPPPPPPPSTVFPDPSHNMLQPGFNTEWFNNPAIPTLGVGDVPSSLPFAYHASQPQGITDDDKVVRNKQSDLSEYVNAPEFLPLQFPESQYSLATANFMSPNYTQDFAQQAMMQPLQPSMDATTTVGGLLTAPRMNPGFPASQFHMNSVYPPNPIIPGNMAGTPLRPPTQQGMYGSMGGMRQFNTHAMHNTPSIGPFGVGNYGMHSNMRTAAMGAEKNRRNDKMGMGDKGGSHPMFYPKLDQMGQYNPSLRKTSPTTFSPMVPQNLRNYTPNHRGGGNYRGPRKSNGSNSGYIKSYGQHTIGLPPTLHPSQLRPNQPFISLVGPVRAQQQPPHSAQMRNTNAPYRGKNMPYYPRHQQIPYANMFYYPPSNRTPHSGPHITTVTAPSIEAALPSNIPHQNLSFQVQNEGDLGKSALGGPQFNIQMTDQIPSSHKFHSFPTDPNAEDSVASEYSKVGPVAVNGKSDDGIGEKIHGDSLFIGTVSTIISSDPMPTDLTLKSHIEVSSSSPPSAMDMYGPAPLVSGSNLGSGPEIPSFQTEDTLSLLPSDKSQEEQSKPQVNLEP